MSHSSLVPVRFRIRDAEICIHVAPRFRDAELYGYMDKTGIVPIRGAMTSRIGFSIVFGDRFVLTYLPSDQDWRELWAASKLGEIVYFDIEALRAFIHVSKFEHSKSRGDRGDGKHDQAKIDAIVAMTLAEWRYLKAKGGRQSGLGAAAMAVATRKDVPVPSRWKGDFENTLQVRVKREIAKAESAASKVVESV